MKGGLESLNFYMKKRNKNFTYQKHGFSNVCGSLRDHQEQGHHIKLCAEDQRKQALGHSPVFHILPH